MDETLKQIKVELKLGEKPKKLAGKYEGYSYQKILAIRKKMKEDDNKQDNLTLATIEPKIVKDVINDIKDKIEQDNTPKTANKLIQEIDKVVDNTESLRDLHTNFQNTIKTLLKEANTMAISDDITPKDWSMLATGVSSLYSTLFSNNSTTVQVLNQVNSSGSDGLSMFKSALTK